MKINPGNTRGLLVPQGDRPFSFVVYSSEIRDFGFPETLQNLLQARHLEVGELFLFGCHGSDQGRDRVLVFLPVVNEFEGIEADFRRFVELQEVAVQLFIELFVGLARVDHPDLRTFR